MTRVKIGVKIWRVTPDLKELIERGRPDFIETMAIVGEDYSPLKGYGLPVTIHAEHIHFGVNQADPLLIGKNTKSLDFALKTADMLGSDVIVLHPGALMNHGCSMQAAIDFIKGAYDPRIIVENMPNYTSGGGKILNVGSGIKEMKQILSATKAGFCLDIDHAAVAATDSGLEYMKVIREFMALNPDYFHVSDTTLKSKQGDHLHLGEGELDMLGMKKLLPKGARVALETPVDVDGRIRDIKFLRE
jgi:sugar phosphate isomerase/epimerase